MCYYTSEVACPYFQAVSPRRQTDIARSAMLPLGDAWDGVCRATPDTPCQPDEVTLLHHCNLGYARGSCARFPREDGPDAARFTIAAENAESVRVYYVLERDYLPWSHGPLEFSRCDGAVTGGAVADPIRELARAYLTSYLRRISEASAR